MLRGKLDLVTVVKFDFHFSRVLGSVVDKIIVSPRARVAVNHALLNVQNVCALTKVDNVLKKDERGETKLP